MALLVQCLPHKHEDPSSSLQHPHKKPGAEEPACNPSAAGRREDAWACWPAASLEIRELSSL